MVLPPSPHSATTEPDWPRLLGGVKSGDEAAARGLVDALYPLVIRVVRSHFRNHSDEEDMVQEIYMRIFAKIDQFRGNQPFPHWVSKVAVNHCVDRLRKAQRQRVKTYADLDVDEAAFVDALIATPSTAAETSPELTLEILDKLMACLSPDEQVMIRLLDLEQKSVKEIAALTGWGESKIKVGAMRARQKLAQKLQFLDKSALK